MSAAAGGWSIERRVETARALHGPWPAPEARRRRVAGVCSVVGPSTVVLGSTQSTGVVDHEQATALGVDVVRRSSGGGAVLVEPGAQVWLDVWLPRDDPLWDDDVIRSSWWLGETWRRALEGLHSAVLAVHRRRATRTMWSDVVCFAGVGPGEVTAGPAKVVGIAQRRTRAGARLHSMAVLSWEPAALVRLLARSVLDEMEPASEQSPGRALSALDHVATGVRDVLATPRHPGAPGLVVSAVEEALLGALP